MIEFALGGVVIGGFLGILLAVLLLNIFPGRWGPWAIAFALAFAPFASAQHVVYPNCVTPLQVQTHYNAPAVAQYHANPAVIALFLDSYYLGQNAVPSIASHADAPAQSACEKRTDALEAKFDRLLLAIAERQQPPQVAPLPLPAGPIAPPPLAQPRVQEIAPVPQAAPKVQQSAVPVTAEQIAALKRDPIAAGLAVCNKNCANCHDAKAPKGGFTLLVDGKFAPLSWEQRMKTVKSIRDGDMPKSGELSDYEEEAIIAAMTSLPAPQVAAK